MSDRFADDCCLSIFEDVWRLGVMLLPHGARVLEIGCAEADWMTPMLAERPDLRIVGIDWRGCERPGEVIQGDVLTYDWPRHTFDAVVGVSSIEHIGLGHYSGDPLDPDGDTHCMQRAVRWLKPGGVVYLDVPYDTQFWIEGTAARFYDDAAVTERLLVPGLVDQGRWYTSLARTPLSTVPPASDAPRPWIVAVVAHKES